jgi:dephospho-CoA kinase
VKLFGITGGIGSGKSYFARKRAQEGFPVYNSDLPAKRLAEEDPKVRRQIRDLLGDGAYAGGHYQTAYVAAKVFDPENGPALLKALNAILHPAVKADLLRWKEEHRQAEKLYVDSALLFESGLNELCDQVICVTAPVDVRLARVMERDGVSEQAVRARMATQMDEAERQRRSDIIYTNGI